MGHKRTGRILSLVENLVNLVTITGALLLFLYGCYAIWDTNIVVSTALPVQYEAYKPEENQLSFEELKKINNDVIGWISIYGTNIDYPLVQADNNEKYLAMDAQGKYSLSGSIFLDYRNDAYFQDFNSIIYGHHMAYHAMFGDISNYKEKAFFNTHSYGNLYYDGTDYGLEFFAFTELDVYSTNMYAPALVEEGMRQAYLDEIMQHFMYVREIEVTANDRIVLLSTCTTDITNGRHVLVGRITDQVYEDSYAEKEKPSVNALIEANKDIISTWVLVIAIVCIAIMTVILKARENQVYKHRKNRERKGD